MIADRDAPEGLAGLESLSAEAELSVEAVVTAAARTVWLGFGCGGEDSRTGYDIHGCILSASVEIQELVDLGRLPAVKDVFEDADVRNRDTEAVVCDSSFLCLLGPL